MAVRLQEQIISTTELGEKIMKNCNFQLSDKPTFIFTISDIIGDLTFKDKIEKISTENIRSALVEWWEIFHREKVPGAKMKVFLMQPA